MKKEKYERSWAMPEKEENARYGYKTSPEEIASFLSSYTKDKCGDNSWIPDTEDGRECCEALYQLYAICQNEYNSSFYRTLYKTLAKATEVFQYLQQRSGYEDTVSEFTSKIELTNAA